jgi:hypothetical protein
MNSLYLLLQVSTTPILLIGEARAFFIEKPELHKYSFFFFLFKRFMKQFELKKRYSTYRARASYEVSEFCQIYPK